MLDRLLEHAHRIALDGESLRRQPPNPTTQRSTRSQTATTKIQSTFESTKEVKPDDH